MSQLMYNGLSSVGVRIPRLVPGTITARR